MNPAQDFIVQQEIRKYRTRIDQWQQSVERARTVRDITRAATQRPSASGLASAMRSIWGSDLARAEKSIEQKLEKVLLHEADSQTETVLQEAQRSLSGHFPRIAARLELALRQRRQAAIQAPTTQP